MSLKKINPTKKDLQNLRHNERRVLQVLRRMGVASKADIARAAGLTNAAIGSIVSSLEKQKLIISGKKKKQGQRGQPATLLHLNPVGAYGLGVRIERNAIQTVLIDFDGNILFNLNHEMVLPEPEKALMMVCEDIQSILSRLPRNSRSRLMGLGLAQPYNLGSWLKELGLPRETFKKWDDFDFAAGLAKETNIRVHQENDGTSAAIAELFYGVGREIDDFLYIFFGPAIGGGLVVRGDIVRGSSGNAADIGLMPVSPSRLKTAPKPKARHDILLNRASLNSLRRHLSNGSTSNELQLRSELEESIKKNGELFEQWLDDCIEAIVPSIMSSKAIIDFRALVISANIDAGLTKKLKSRIKKELKFSMPESRFPPDIITGTFGSNAGAVGAASLPIFYNFSPRKPIS